MLEFIFPFK